MRTVDLPAALPDGGRFLHIGLPKTGTTALQGALNRARPELEALGVHNVSSNRHEMRVGQVAAGALAEFWGQQWNDRWTALATDFRTSQARCTFWSSESLSHTTGERIGYLRDQLGADTHIVATLRPLAPLLVSQWQQALRRRGTKPLETWMQRQFEAVTPEGELRSEPEQFLPVLHRFSLARLIEEWGGGFGEERVILVVPDLADRQRNFRVFESLMGVGEVLTPSAEDNASLPYPEAEMLRQFNRAYTANGGDHPTWMQTIAVRARQPMRDYTRLTERHPIQAPRWVAERANAYTRAWIDQISDSDITVVGDLADLLVDPADYPDQVEVPTEVTIESAGRMMQVGFAAALEHSAATASAAPEPAPASALDQAGGRELVRELGRRMTRRLPGRRR